MKNKICPLCGQQFSNHSCKNKDHLIPRAVALWSKELLTKNTLPYVNISIQNIIFTGYMSIVITINKVSCLHYLK